VPPRRPSSIDKVLHAWQSQNIFQAVDYGGLSVLAMFAVAVVGLSALRNNLLEDRKAKLQDVILLAR
jgi:hypothetical protein